MPINMKQLRREFEAASKGRETHRFFDELYEGLEKKEIVSSDFSIRELCEEFIPDGREMVDSWNPSRGGGGHSLTEVINKVPMYNSVRRESYPLLEADAVKTAAFSNISGQIIYNEILQGFESEAFVFSAMIPETQTQFSGEKIAGIGAIGDLAEVVEEAQPYPMVGVQEDWIRTAETLKRGMIVPVTREAIFFDRTGQLLEQARGVGEALGLNKEKRAVDCVIDENTTTHRYNRKDLGAVQTYDDNTGNHDWDNLHATGATENALVDWTDIDNADQLLNEILDPNTGEPVIVMATTLICAKGLEKTALYIRNATEVRIAAGGFPTTGNPQQTSFPNPVGGAFEVVSSRFINTRQDAASEANTTWYYGDPRRAFRYMRNFALTTVQAPANSEMEFTHDIAMRWKSSERGSYNTIEPRAMVKNEA